MYSRNVTICLRSSELSRKAMNALSGKFKPAATAIVMSLWNANGVRACDEFASRLIDKAIRPAIENLDCGLLGRAGLDVRDHHLLSVCYTSSGPTSEIEIVADLKCKTSDHALIRLPPVGDKVAATAMVRASDCQILSVTMSTPGDVGQFLLRALDANGQARLALVQALSKLC